MSNGMWGCPPCDAASTSGGGCSLPDASPPRTCSEACSNLYDCGALLCNGSRICQGFSGEASEKTDFIGDADNGCLEDCMEQMALIAVIDPSDCELTVAILESLDPDFAEACDNRFGGSN